MCDSVCVEKFVVQLISRHACGMCAAKCPLDFFKK
jgi:hypothetical protein